jgi:hypothetical protein
MTNEAIAKKLAWLKRGIDKINVEAKGRDHLSAMGDAVNAYNEVREALRTKLKHIENPSYPPNNWRDAFEITLLFADNNLQTAAQIAKISID